MDLKRLAQNADAGHRARRRMELTGITPNGHPLWDGIERRNLVNGYPDYPSVVKLNTHRTTPAHYSKAGREKITRARAPAWNDNEILRLRRDFPRLTKAEMLLAFPGRTWPAIRKKANQRGVFRGKRRFAPTGIPLLDTLLGRAWVKRLTLADLDHVARRPKYFVSQKWKRDPARTTVICYVIEKMGGTVRAKWSVVR